MRHLAPGEAIELMRRQAEQEAYDRERSKKIKLVAELLPAGLLIAGVIGYIINQGW